MFLDRERYVELKEWNKFGISAIYTKKNYGNIKEMSKEKILKDFSLEGKYIVSGFQTHSDNIVVVDSLEKLYFEDTDGFITNRKDIVILTKYADCLPIYFFDEKKEIIGTVHSGWQGSYKEIGKKAIKLMIDTYGCNLGDIRVAFGIGISQKNYEVEEEFLQKFKEKFSKELIEKSFKNENGKIYFDNQEFVYRNLLELGLLKENIVLNKLCTYEGEFHSYRRDREKSGRNGALIYKRYITNF